MPLLNSHPSIVEVFGLVVASLAVLSFFGALFMNLPAIRRYYHIRHL